MLAISCVFLSEGVYTTPFEINGNLMIPRIINSTNDYTTLLATSDTIGLNIMDMCISLNK